MWLLDTYEVHYQYKIHFQVSIKVMQCDVDCPRSFMQSCLSSVVVHGGHEQAAFLRLWSDLATQGNEHCCYFYLTIAVSFLEDVFMVDLTGL